MLILSREKGKDIIFGDNIVVKVTKIEANRVQLHIRAPTGTLFHLFTSEDKVEDPAVRQNLPLAEGPNFTRKKNEGILMNGNLKIIVVEIRGDKVRLGADGPREISIFRKEIHDTLQRTKAVLRQTKK